MDRCNELCTQEMMGYCRLCEALTERERFERFWFKGAGVIEGIRALKRRGLFAFSPSWRPYLLLGFAALLLYVVVHYFWVIPNRNLAMERITPSWKRELTQKESHELRNSFRQTLVQALGGAALLLGLYFTARTLRISQETLRVTQEGQITERFTQAIEHLGDHDHLMIRLGGIYALARIARDSDRDHWPIMEVLTAYVRANAPWPPKQAQQPADGPGLEGQSPEIHTHAPSTAEDLMRQRTPIDIQAILTIIGQPTRSSNREEMNRLDLRNTDLRFADLHEAHLEGADLMGAHLEGASLRNAHLEGAFLYNAHLEGANLIGAHLERAYLSNARLEEGDLSDAHLEGASLRNAHLEGASLHNAHLKWENLLVADLLAADLRGAHLEGADLIGADPTVAQLVAVYSLYEADLDPKLKEEIQRIAPHLLQRPS
jgi:uncharacterized protein YjbI with pentapeptide repeats